MRRTSPRRPSESAGISSDKASESAPNSAPAAPAAPAASGADDTSERIAWGWRLALFLWGASFAFLFLYEILITLFRGGGR